MIRAFSAYTIARALGFAAGGSAFTCLLALVTRPMRLGPGFSNLIPYAAAAILLTGAGHLIRAWLGQAGFPERTRNAGLVRDFGAAFPEGIRLFFKGTAAFNNFLFLSIAYILGIGLTSLFMRGKGEGKPASAANPPGSHWRELKTGKEEADAFYRPF
jgi:hypothetical protein